jgi:aminoglycoside phosphotransferase (APT) family kinase protein
MEPGLGLKDVQRDFSIDAATYRLLLAWLQTLDGPSVRFSEVRQIPTVSRNVLLRLKLEGGTYDSVIAKHVSHSTDPFFAHHLRREERVLDLLQTFARGIAPRCLGILLDQTKAGWLCMTDGGERSLADVLRSSPASAHEGLLASALGRVRDLHEAFAAHRVPFYRTCYAVNLDRLTRETLGNRFRVAWRRIAQLTGGRDEPPPSLIEHWVATMAPLLSEQRRLLHNSLSPLSVVLDELGTMTIVDFETVTLGAVEFDYAELLLQPFGPIDLATTLRLLESQGERLTETFVRRVQLASLCRCFDYVGANARQVGNDDADRNQSIKDRLCWYAHHVQELASQIGTLPGLVAHLDTLQASAI